MKNVATTLNNTMPMECVRTAIIPRVEQRKHLNVVIKTELFTPKASVKIVTSVLTINKKEIRKERILIQCNLKILRS